LESKYHLQYFHLIYPYDALIINRKKAMQETVITCIIIKNYYN
jgi:hypothetical protein